MIGDYLNDLERDLAAARERIAALEAERDRLREVLKQLLEKVPMEGGLPHRWQAIDNATAALAGEEKP